jgi:hypothetical protein
MSGSQEYVGWDGIEYDTVISRLRANPAMSTDELGVAFSESATNDRTWSTIALDGRLDALVTAVDQWAAALTAGVPAHRKALTTAFGATRTFWQAPMDKDLVDMATEVERVVPSAAIKAASRSVITAAAAAILYERITPAYADAQGLTIYHPSSRARCSTTRRTARSTSRTRRAGTSSSTSGSGSAPTPRTREPRPSSE